jgi:DNA-binding beta-propeller fold protein YncE
VGAVLCDPLRRVAVLGGRDGMPRSLGSVYGGSITRFLGGSLRGVKTHAVKTPGVASLGNGVAVSVDGGTLLVSDWSGGSHAIHAFSVADGSLLRVVGGLCDGPLQFYNPSQVWVAGDGFVFVADCGNNRVQVLTPCLDFHCFVGVGELGLPAGVCANADIIVVSETRANRVSVFRRGDGALLRRIGSSGSGDGKLSCPRGLCFMLADARVAVADSWNNRVSVFSVDGDFIRHVGVGALTSPFGVVCSAFDELVVADRSRLVRVFGAIGEVLVKVQCEQISTGVAMHGGALFVQSMGPTCAVFH